MGGGGSPYSATTVPSSEGASRNTSGALVSTVGVSVTSASVAGASALASEPLVVLPHPASAREVPSARAALRVHRPFTSGRARRAKSSGMAA